MLEKNSEQIFREIYTTLLKNGKEISPRGQKVIEIEDFSFNLPPYIRFANFESRKLNLNYIKHEFMWYLKGDKFDTSITKYASLWRSLIKDDGSINSNYGQYIFGNLNQFTLVEEILLSDKDSRRASMVILQPYHITSGDKDMPCTYGINFRIRDNKLNMTVHMRSQDAIFGMCNDIPTFSFIHEMMYVVLRDTKYNNLEYGNYHHCVDSFHVYEKHYEMINKIVYQNDKFNEVECPKMKSSAEVGDMMLNYFAIQPFRDFSIWLTDFGNIMEE